MTFDSWYRDRRRGAPRAAEGVGLRTAEPAEQRLEEVGEAAASRRAAPLTEHRSEVSEVLDAVAFLQDLMVGKVTYDRLDAAHLRRLGNACRLLEHFGLLDGLLPELEQKIAGLKATAEGAFSLIGGGDSVACINKFGMADQVSYISTGGGALLEAIEGKELPGVAAICKK